MRKIAASVSLVFIAGCASLYDPIPPGRYDGPFAGVTDTGTVESDSKAQVFALMEIDGKPVDNSIYASRKASQNQGFRLTARYVNRAVLTAPMKVKIIGTHITAAPIQEIIARAAGTFLSVEGIVDFTPVDKGNYAVKGILSKEGSSVWIEDVATKQPVTAIVRSK